MGQCYATNNIQVRPKSNISEKDFFYGLPSKTRFNEKNIFHSDPHLAKSMENLEKEAKEIMFIKVVAAELNKMSDKIREELLESPSEQHLRESAETVKFVNKIAQDLMDAKEKMDDCVYRDLHRNSHSYSIIPFYNLDP